MLKKYKNSLFYILTIAIFSALMYWVVMQGENLQGQNQVQPAATGQNEWGNFLDALYHNLQHPLAILLAQIVTIIFTARIFGWVCRKIGQPSVIGEIAAGIVLGPSLVGSYFPEFSQALFPAQSLGNLQFLSQIGLILFMFVIGMELDLKVLKTKAQDAIVISHASIIIPFALGMGLAYFIYEVYAPDGVQFLSFGLFLGIAMSITAFPVLARIVQERGIHKTRLGTIVITCAAADDITAWCLLAAVIAIVKAGSFVSSLYVILLAAIYVLIMIKVVRPFLRRVGELYSSSEKLSRPIVAIFFLTLIISSYATEVIGIHALFGAFMAGAIMPENARFRSIFVEKVEDVSLVLLLPLFFVFTGLRTQIGLLNDVSLWQVCGWIIAVAVTGKFLGSAMAARFVGQNWRDSLTIGALMNTRGLMELVVLNIGYDLGVLSPEIFAMMVIMALFTTFMTGPVLDLINWIFRKTKPMLDEQLGSLSKYKVLLSFNKPERGVSLLRLGNALVRKLEGNASLTAMHLAPSNELHHYNLHDYEEQTFAPLVETSAHLQQKMTTLFKATGNPDAETVELANKGDYDLLMVAVEPSIFEGTLLGKILGFTTRIINPDKLLGQVTGRENLFENSPFDESTRQILSKSSVPVAVLIDKGFLEAKRVFVPIFSKQDAFLIRYCQKLINNAGAQVTLLDAAGELKNYPDIKESIRAIEHTAPQHIHLLKERVLDKNFLTDQDLMLISVDSWKKLLDSKSVWLSDIPSTLIIADK